MKTPKFEISGRALRMVIKYRRLTCRSLAAKAGVSPCWISNLCTEKYNAIRLSIPLALDVTYTQLEELTAEIADFSDEQIKHDGNKIISMFLELHQ